MILCTLGILIVSILPPTMAVISGKTNVCINGDSGLPSDSNCQNRLHTQAQLTYHGITEKYIFRSEKNEKQLIISLKGDELKLIYDLDYRLDVPFNYIEKNADYSWSSKGSHCSASCADAIIEGCSTKKDIPKTSIKNFNFGVCCQCGKNADSSSQRANFACDSLSEAFQENVCMSKACLKAVNPWYSVSGVAYPPRYHRTIQVTIEEVGRNDPFHCQVDHEKNTCKDEKHDISIKLSWSKSQDGQEAPLISNFIFVPSYPPEDPKVKASSIKNFCGLSESEAKDLDLLGKKCLENALSVESDAVDTKGTSCNKIGVSPTHWGRESRLCNSPKNSCVNNQLEWYLREFPKRSALPKIYGSDPIANFGAIVTDKNKKEEMIRSISYKITSKPHISSILIDTPRGNISELHEYANAKITSAEIAECSEANQCYAEIKINNPGEKPSQVYLNLKCTVNDKPLGGAEETSVEVARLNTITKKVLINISNYTDVGGICKGTIMSSKREVVDKIEFPITIKLPERSNGPNVQSLDMKVGKKKAAKIESGAGGCECRWYNLICFFKNFSTCVWGKFTGFYKIIVIVCGIVLAIMCIYLIVAIIRSFTTRNPR